VNPARPWLVVLVCCALAACATRTIETGAPRTVRTGVGAAVGQPASRLRFGVPSLDRLNAKYQASQLVKVVDMQRSYILRIAPDANVFRALDEYGKDPLVAHADLHYMMRLPAPQAPEAVSTKTGPLRKEDRPFQPAPQAAPQP